MFWDDRYSEPGYAYGTEPNDWIRESADAVIGPVLCIAEGEGRNAVFLAEQGHEVHMMDASPVGVENTKALAAERGVTVHAQRADLAIYPFGEAKWGTIVGVFHHLPAPLRAYVHRRIIEALVPGGAYIFEAYTPRQLDHGTGGPPVEAMLFEPDVIRGELEGLELEHFEEVERELSEGKYHNGPSAVLRAICRKPL